MGSKFRSIQVFTGTVFLLTIANANYAVPERAGPSGYGSLDLVASIDGKKYYANHKYRQNYLESSEYCRDFGMELASIQTRKHYYELMEALKDFNNHGYWTSATFSRQPSMFVWKDTLKFLEAGEIPSWQTRWLRRTYCVIIYNSNTAVNPAGLYVVDCNSKQPVLCQISLKLE